MNDLTQIQTELKVPKSQYNNFGKYKFRNCEDILTAIKPFLIEYKSQLTLSDEVVCQGDWHYVKATATFVDHEGKTTQSVAFAREDESRKGMSASQVTGTASSYARKYALGALFLLDDTKDADTNEYQSQQWGSRQQQNNNGWN